MVIEQVGVLHTTIPLAVSRKLTPTRVFSTQAHIDGYFYGWQTRYRYDDIEDDNQQKPVVQVVSLNFQKSPRKESSRIKRFKNKYRHRESKGRFAFKTSYLIDNNSESISLVQLFIKSLKKYGYVDRDKFIGLRFNVKRARSVKVDTRSIDSTKLYLGTLRQIRHSDISNASGAFTDNFSSGHIAEMRLLPFSRRVTVLKMDNIASDWRTKQFKPDEIAFAQRMAKCGVIVISSDGILVEAGKKRR